MRVVSFGKGSVDVFMSPEMYFGDRILSTIKEEKEYLPVDAPSRFINKFAPYRRLNEISKDLSNPTLNKCRISTYFPADVYQSVVNFFAPKYQDARKLIWQPDSFVITDSGRILNYENNGYKLGKDIIEVNCETKSAIIEFVKKSINDVRHLKKDDFVIAIGNKEQDLEFLNPFSYKKLESSFDNFKKIKDLPFRSAFIYNKNTSEALMKKLRALEKICNADGNVRFAIVPDKIIQSHSAIVHSILLLQKEYAKKVAAYRDSISPLLKKLLEITRLEYVTPKAGHAGIKYEPAPFWLEPSKNLKEPFSTRFFRYVKNNKLACSIVATAVGVPIYFRIMHYSEKDKSSKSK